jgi:ADP-ribose pyrophosphatase YjhB (NUDIX family)
MEQGLFPIWDWDLLWRDVAFAIIKDAATPRVLVVRSTEVSRDGNRKWMLPGGKIDAGETPLVAACRVLQEESGFEQALVQLTGTGGDDGPHVEGRVVFFLKEFDFGGLGHDRRVAIFKGRGTPRETSDYGFATLLPDGVTVQVQGYGGTAKSQSELRRGTRDPLLRAFASM